jgi:hypothetical protein
VWNDVIEQDRRVFVEGSSPCDGFENGDIVLCSGEIAEYEVETSWGEAEVVWSMEDVGVISVGSNQISLNEPGNYLLTVLHQGTVLCESSFQITQELIGDITGDGVVGSADVLVLISAYGCQTNCSIDFTSNGSTDVNDLLFLLMTFGDSC